MKLALIIFWNTDMAIGLVGKKVGMTRVFTEEGVSIPVTVVEVAPNLLSLLRQMAMTQFRLQQVRVKRLA